MLTIKIKTAILRDATKQMLPVIPRKSTMPVLQCILFEFKENQDIILYSSNLEIMIEKKLNIESKDYELSGDFADKGFLINGNEISRIINDITAETITIQYHSDKQELLLIFDKGKFKLRTLQAVEYIDINNLKFEPKATILLYKETIKAAFEQTKESTSKDEYRPSMTGINIKVSDNTIEAAATDSYTLFIHYSQMKKAVKNPFSFIMPLRAFEIVSDTSQDYGFSVKRDAALEDKPIKIVCFLSSEKNIYCRVIDEKYPPYESVMPDILTGQPIEVKFENISEAIKLVGHAVSEISKAIKIKVVDNNMIFESNDTEKTKSSEISIACNSETNAEIALNHNYLYKVLRKYANLNPESLLIYFWESNRPVVILAKGSESSDYALMMPIRLDTIS